MLLNLHLNIYPCLLVLHSGLICGLPTHGGRPPAGVLVESRAVHMSGIGRSPRILGADRHATIGARVNTRDLSNLMTASNTSSMRSVNAIVDDIRTAVVKFKNDPVPLVDFMAISKEAYAVTKAAFDQHPDALVPGGSSVTTSERTPFRISIVQDVRAAPLTWRRLLIYLDLFDREVLSKKRPEDQPAVTHISYWRRGDDGETEELATGLLDRILQMGNHTTPGLSLPESVHPLDSGSVWVS